MNWFVTPDGSYAVNLDAAKEVVRHNSGKVVIYFTDKDESVLHDADAAALWRRITGQPDEDDARAAVAEFRRLTGDPGHATGPTPIEALGEPPAELAAIDAEVA